jgi:probable phosphoglycerate mutase
MAAMATDSPEQHRAAARQLPYALPQGATEIILVRHGASAVAAPGRRFPLLMGRGDPPLSAAGERQADAVMSRLRNEPVAAIYVTPLQRTHRTAAPLAGALGIGPLVIDELIEVSLGDWEGGEYRLRAAAGDPIVRQVFAEERWDAIPGGESLDSLAERVRAGILRIAELTGPDRTAVAVLHGGVIGEVCRQATRSRPLAFAHSENGSISRVVLSADGAWLLRAFNETSHLPEGAGE